MFSRPVFAESPEVYKDPETPLEQRVEDLFARLTQEEKITLLGGVDAIWQPIPRLGVPPLRMVDGGLAVRGLGVPGKSAALAAILFGKIESIV